MNSDSELFKDKPNKNSANNSHKVYINLNPFPEIHIKQ